MTSLNSKVPLDNEEENYLRQAIPDILKRAFNQTHAECEKTPPTDAGVLLPLEEVVKFAREAYPESQDVLGLSTICLNYAPQSWHLETLKG